MKRFWTRPVTTLVSVATLTVMACTPAAPAAVSGGSNAPAPPPADFSLRIAANFATTMDPMSSIGTVRRYGVYEALVGQDYEGKVIPELASEWKSLNPTTWQFKLVAGRKFHDGSPVTPEDVKYSYDRGLNPANKLGILTRIASIKSVDIVDSSTVNIVTNDPDPLLLKRAAVTMILKKAYVDKPGGPEELSTKGLGTGPYKQKEFLANDRLVLVKNTEHPKQPAASEITMLIITEESAKVNGLRSGDLDIAQNISPDRAEALVKEGYKIVNFNQGVTNGLFIYPNIPNKPTNNKLVRQALNYAVDKEAIAKDIYRGFTKPTGQVVQSSTFGYNPRIQPYPYNPTKAKELLAQAGYSNGFSMKLDVSVTSGPLLDVHLLIQKQLKDIGITAEIESYADGARFLDRWYGRIQRNETLAAGLNNAPALDADFALNWFRGNIVESERRYQNADFDKAYLASTVELDPVKRSELLQQAIAIMYEDPPFLFMVDQFTLYVTRPNIEGLFVRGDDHADVTPIRKK